MLGTQRNQREPVHALSSAAQAQAYDDNYTGGSSSPQPGPVLLVISSPPPPLLTSEGLPLLDQKTVLTAWCTHLIPSPAWLLPARKT